MSVLVDVVGYALLAFGAWATLGNLSLIGRGLLYTRSATLIPGFGGVACAVGGTLALDQSLALTVLLPLLVDPGCAYLAGATVVAAVVRRRQARGERE